MIIKPDSVVVVYLNTKQEYHRSVYSRFEILYNEYSSVGYIEDLGVLCCGTDVVYYDAERYLDDIMYSNFEEMTYEQYTKQYQNQLATYNPGAPIISNQPLTVNETINNYGQQNITHQILNSNPVLTNLNNHGIKVQILRG